MKEKKETCYIIVRLIKRNAEDIERDWSLHEEVVDYSIKEGVLYIEDYKRHKTIFNANTWVFLSVFPEVK